MLCVCVSVSEAADVNEGANALTNHEPCRRVSHTFCLLKTVSSSVESQRDLELAWGDSPEGKEKD